MVDKNAQNIFLADGSVGLKCVHWDPGAGVCLDESVGTVMSTTVCVCLNCSTQLNCVFVFNQLMCCILGYAPKLNLYVGNGWIHSIIFTRWNILRENQPLPTKRATTTTTAHSNPAFHPPYVCIAKSATWWVFPLDYSPRCIVCMCTHTRVANCHKPGTYGGVENRQSCNR